MVMSARDDATEQLNTPTGRLSFRNISRITSSIEMILEEIQRRVNFKYSLRDIISQFLCCPHKGKLKLERKQRIFKKATQKINNEFDAINLLKIMKQVKLMSKVFLNPT